MNGYTVMIIEDDMAIQGVMKHGLSEEKYRIIQAGSGLEGLSLFYQENPDIVLMDLTLPDIGGLDVLVQIRQKSMIPVIIVSDSGREEDKVTALDCGADDYVTKPFHMKELQARVRASLRWRQEADVTRETVFSLDYLDIDFGKRKVYVRGQPVHLTPLEYRMLVLLVDNRGKVLTHSYIQQQLWERNVDGDYRRLRVFMSNVRKKIGDEADIPRFIQTEIGVGYRFVDE